MPTLTPERADDLIASWLDATDSNSTPDNPAGPLFLGGKYAEFEITMTGGTGSATMTGCGWCTGSICDGNGIICQ